MLGEDFPKKVLHSSAGAWYWRLAHIEELGIAVGNNQNVFSIEEVVNSQHLPGP